jgi:hypothetical protein
MVGDNHHDDLVLAVAMAAWYGEYQHRHDLAMEQTAAVLADMLAHQ